MAEIHVPYSLQQVTSLRDSLSCFHSSLYFLTCLGINVYGLEFISHALGPLFKHLKHFLLKSCRISPSYVLRWMGCLLLSANQPAKTSTLKKRCMSCLYPQTFRIPTSCNLLQPWLSTPFPNGLLLDRPTKLYKNKLVLFRNMTF